MVKPRSEYDIDLNKVISSASITLSNQIDLFKREGALERFSASDSLSFSRLVDSLVRLKALESGAIQDIDLTTLSDSELGIAPGNSASNSASNSTTSGPGDKLSKPKGEE